MLHVWADLIWAKSYGNETNSVSSSCIYMLSLSSLGLHHQRCGNPIVITVYVSLSARLSVRPSVCPSTLCCNAITKNVSIFKLHTQIEVRERKTPIDFGVKRLKVKVTMRDL